MTAQELYDIVKDVPREAWPSMAEPVNGAWYMDKHPDADTCPMENVVLMFEASMMRWLAKRGTFCIDHMEGERPPVVTSYADGSARTWKGSTIVEALAAACKAVLA